MVGKGSARNAARESMRVYRSIPVSGAPICANANACARLYVLKRMFRVRGSVGPSGRNDGFKSDETRLRLPTRVVRCSDKSLGVYKVPTYDTAGSAKMISEGSMEDCAAIASDLAAEAWGMEILRSNIEDDDINFTRFLILARQVRYSIS